MSLTALVNRLFCALELSTFVTVVEAIGEKDKSVGLAAVFCLLGVATVFYIVFFWVMLPETAGESLEEIEHAWCHLEDNGPVEPGGFRASFVAAHEFELNVNDADAE